MSFHRILVLQSVEDDITERRKWRMQRSPFLKWYEFEHCFAFELTDEQKRVPTEVMMSQVVGGALDENRLVERLARKIEAFKPDTLVIHFGFVFRHFPVQMIYVLKTLKSRFPDLRFGIERTDLLTSKFPETIALFDSSDEIKKLIEHIF